MPARILLMPARILLMPARILLMPARFSDNAGALFWENRYLPNCTCSFFRSGLDTLFLFVFRNYYVPYCTRSKFSPGGVHEQFPPSPPDPPHQRIA